VLDIGTFLPLFLHNFLIVLTVIKVERLFGLATDSSPVTESTENLLVATDEVLRVRLCVFGDTLLIVEDEDCTDGPASQYVDERP
jgi:hypothetical protein